ncbi:MAG: YlbF family regulator [Methylocystaceae bacterium]
MNKEDIIKQAMQLGEALTGSDELLQLKAAQQAVTADLEAYQTIMQYEQQRHNADTKMRQGLALSPEEEAKLGQAEKAVKDNPKVQILIEAQENFDNLMQSIYFVINQAVTGPSCGSGCESCGGHCS